MPRVFQPVDKTVELTVQGTLAGELVENKYYAQGTSAITSVMVAALAAVVDAWIASDFLAQCSSAYVYTRTVARDLTSEASFESIANSNAGSVGGLTGGIHPNNVTVAVHRDTGLSGKKAKSRIYWPGIPIEMSSVDNFLDAAVQTAMLGILDALRGDIIADTSNTWKYGYVQRIIDHVKLTNGNFIEVLSHSFTDAVLDAMRARLPRHGL